MNAILGSGILGLSYAMAQLGIVLFTLICGGVAALALYAIILLLRMCKITGANVSFKYALCLDGPGIPGNRFRLLGPQFGYFDMWKNWAMLL